ncbi:MAG TPA: 16S rRNA (cytidine(1402)-2'-O)-methyltransferase [Microbacteriaceae bacterium]|nr:16S rRNA (cytidine(1402)-2'-O)-methyltransferase [Microbacteriaceae bacterium]
MIILAGTPIGNLGDASARLRDTLESAAIVAAEDTRVAGRLLHGLGIANRPKLIALHEHNERQRAEELAEEARALDLVVVTDAGMPTVSDPGYRIVEAAARVGVPVTVVPGPSAVLAALAVSGLPTDRFTFEGFISKRAGERAAAFAALAAEERTMVFFDSPHRLAASLAALAEAFGRERRAAVCRELTKLHEEVRRDTLGGLQAWAEEGLRGEIVLVVAGAPAAAGDPDAALARVLELVASGTGLKEASATVAAREGLGRRELYEAALAARRSPRP